MKKSMLIIAVTFVFSVLTGCINNKYGSAYIVSDPAGAEVTNIDDGTLLGITPLKQVWRDKGRLKFINIQLDKEGYRDKATSFWLTLKHPTHRSAINDTQLVDIKLDSKTSNKGSKSLKINE